MTPVLKDVREYIDRLHIEGHTVSEDYDDDPILIDPYGKAVDTWRENYPYEQRLSREQYDAEKYALQVELLKLQNHQIETGERHVLLFEGRDAAGKGGTIKRFTEHLNPRYARVVALTRPTSARRSASRPATRSRSSCRNGWSSDGNPSRSPGDPTDARHAQCMP